MKNVIYGDKDDFDDDDNGERVKVMLIAVMMMMMMMMMKKRMMMRVAGINVMVTMMRIMRSSERGRPTRGRNVSSRGPNLSQHPPSSLSSRGGSQIRSFFLWPAPTKTRTGGKKLNCFSQEMWKATRDPCGTVLYVHIKSLYIKSPFNAIIPPLIRFTSKAHTSDPNPTHPHSYVTHIKSLTQKLLLTHTI